MASFLSQEEIDSLLNTQDTQDYGSPEFEKLVKEYNSDKNLRNLSISLKGKNPEDFMKQLQINEKYFNLLEQAKTKHNELKEKLEELMIEQPELYI